MDLTFVQLSAAGSGVLFVAWLLKRRRAGELTVRIALVGENDAAHAGTKSTRKETSESAADGSDDDVRTRFLIDSILLRRFFEFVTRVDEQSAYCEGAGFKEVFHYASGLQVSKKCFVIGHIVPVEFAKQSASGVRVADESNIRALSTLDEMGLPLVCHVHSHPGCGPGATLVPPVKWGALSAV